MPPIISIVGKSKTGKTTLLEALISELKSRGYHVATMKHCHHTLSFDKPNKDSWRHIQAGSEATAIVSLDQIFLTKPKPLAEYPDLNKIARLFGDDYDIILAEGFKQGSAPKIEVHRKAAGPPLGQISNLIAIATDEPLETKARQFPLDDIKGLVDLLENDFIKPK